MDDYDEAEQWEKARKQGNNIRANIAKDLNKSSILKILDDITPDLYPDDDSDTSRWSNRSGEKDLERHSYLKKQLEKMSAKEKQDLMKRYAKKVFDPRKGLDAWDISKMQWLEQQAPLGDLKKAEKKVWIYFGNKCA